MERTAAKEVAHACIWFQDSNELVIKLDFGAARLTLSESVRGDTWKLAGSCF